MSTDPPLPTELQVEVTGACNLRCRMCLVRYRPPLDRITGSMDLGMFRRLVDELPALRKITLQGLGEPLLAPDLFSMIEYSAARGIDVGFNTNGTLVTRATARRLVDSGLAWLHVSVDGATPEVYEHVRDRARFERVASNVQGLIDVKRAAGSARPEVMIVTVAMRSNLPELADIVRLSHEWGVDRCWIQQLSHSFSDTDPAGEYAGIRAFVTDEALGDDADVHEALECAARVAADLGVALRLPQSERETVPAPDEPACDWPFARAYVTHDGTVQPCCMVMGSDRARLGSVAQGSIADVWTSQPARTFRARLMPGADAPPEPCRGCALYRRVF
jgi:radical SAM protein with 4Fe4S-binding SPASM domain